jgi:hypothetical protein
MRQILLLFIIGLLLTIGIYFKQSEGFTKTDANEYLDSMDGSMNSSYDISMTEYIYSLINKQETTCPGTTPKPTDPPCPTAAPIKCVADFGTNIGEPLSGGKGVLQDTRYICPNTLKKCSHFKCGSAFGTCTSE